MTGKAPRLLVRGELDISSPTDRFTLRGDESTLSLTGNSLRSFLRLRQQVSRLPLPDWAAAIRNKLSGRSSFLLECRCRGRTIATVVNEGEGIRIRSHSLQILRVALRL